MTVFLWIVVILMAAALLAEILAFVGMALVARRAARRARAMQEEVKQKLEGSVHIVKEMRLSLQPHLEVISRDGKELASLLESRLRVLEAAYLDASRRAEGIRLRLNQGVRTVEQQGQAQRGMYREVMEPIEAASKIFRGLSLALWLLRKVA
jgi:hypothetical protein